MAWPKVIEKIADRPFFGYGRMGMQQSGASTEMIYEYGRGAAFGHPHNAYLELLIDNGFIGAAPLFGLFIFLAFYSVQLTRENQSPELLCVGGLGISFIVGQLIAGMTAQSFYPRQGVVLMWCVIGILSRVYVDRNASKPHV